MATGDQLTAVKLSDLTRTSTTTPTIDPDLQVTLAANTTYIFELTFRATSAGNQAIRFDFQAPGSLVRDHKAQFYGTFRTSSNDTQSSQIGSTGDEATSLATDVDTGIDSGISTTSMCRCSGLLTTGGSGGTVGLRWAQRISTATATTLFAGAFLIVTEA